MQKRDKDKHYTAACLGGVFSEFSFHESLQSSQQVQLIVQLTYSTTYSTTYKISFFTCSLPQWIQPDLTEVRIFVLKMQTYIPNKWSIVLLPWTPSTQTKTHINTSISWEIHNPFILVQLSQNGSRRAPPCCTSSSDFFSALILSTSRLKESSSGHKQFLQPHQLL